MSITHLYSENAEFKKYHDSYVYIATFICSLQCVAELTILVIQNSVCVCVVCVCVCVCVHVRVCVHAVYE